MASKEGDRRLIVVLEILSLPVNLLSSATRVQAASINVKSM